MWFIGSGATVMTSLPALTPERRCAARKRRGIGGRSVLIKISCIRDAMYLYAVKVSMFRRILVFLKASWKHKIF